MNNLKAGDFVVVIDNYSQTLNLDFNKVYLIKGIDDDGYVSLDWSKKEVNGFLQKRFRKATIEEIVKAKLLDNYK